ncbi:fructose-specific PTS transporter subunit EIIC [Streptomyces sp. NPDC087425]|uniref:fructose-specific PTS transporter subunit EIIC n=1 Tax=unclassified Streptomyces TaxID=2593676 RepID=UPI00380E839C
MPHPRTRTAAPSVPMDQGDAQGRHAGVRIGRWLAAGVPWFAPFVAISAVMNVLALALGGPDITDTADQVLGAGDWSQPHTWAALLLKIGSSGLGFLPVGVAGYLAYGIAGRPGLIPGLLGGMAAMGVQGGVLVPLAAGLIAGGVTVALQRIPFPATLRDPAANVLLPLLAALITSLAAFVAAQVVLGPLAAWLHQKMAFLEFQNTALLGMFLGLMVCCDLGGAISRTAVAFATVGVSGYDASKFSPIDITIMAAVMAAGMVPPLGMTLATLVRRTVFSDAERAYGKVSWLFGAASLPQGAVPFALSDPLRVIPAGMAGGAVSGALVMTFGSTFTVPYGGLLAVGDLGRPLLFGVAVIAGALVTAAVAVGLKSLRSPVPLAPPAATRPVPPRARNGRKASATA